MNLKERIAGADFLLLDAAGISLAGEGLTLDEAGPFIERLHASFDAGETDHAMWRTGPYRFLGAAVDEGVLIVRCGDAMPLTKALYLLDDLRERCRALMR